MPRPGPQCSRWDKRATSELTGSEETPSCSGYLGVQCSDLFCILAYILYPQLLAQIHSERALAQVTVCGRHRKRTRRGGLLKTVEILFSSEVLCPAEMLKATFCTFEVLWALHSPHDLFNLLPVFVFDGFLLRCRTTAIWFSDTDPGGASSLLRGAYQPGGTASNGPGGLEVKGWRA